MAPKSRLIYNILRKRIQAMAPGDRLPTVLELRREFDVSQHSVCRALDDLEREDLIVKLPRAGIQVGAGASSKGQVSGVTRVAYAAWMLSEPVEWLPNGIHPFFHPLLNSVMSNSRSLGYECNVYPIDRRGISGSETSLEADIKREVLKGLIISGFHFGDHDPRIPGEAWGACGFDRPAAGRHERIDVFRMQ